MYSVNPLNSSEDNFPNTLRNIQKCLFVTNLFKCELTFFFFCLEGVVHADLKLFLETNLPSTGKKKAMLGVSDAKLGAALQEELDLSIQTGGVVAEIIRGEEVFKMIEYTK